MSKKSYYHNYHTGYIYNINRQWISSIYNLHILVKIQENYKLYSIIYIYIYIYTCNLKISKNVYVYVYVYIYIYIHSLVNWKKSLSCLCYSISNTLAETLAFKNWWFLLFFIFSHDHYIYLLKIYSQARQSSNIVDYLTWNWAIYSLVNINQSSERKPKKKKKRRQQLKIK